MAPIAPYVDAHRRVKLERLSSGRGFGIAEHHADLLSDLIDKDQTGTRLRNRTRQLAQRLRHQPRLQPHVAVPHFAVKFGLGHQRCHGIHHQHVDGVRAHQGLGDLERLLAVVRLRDQQVVDIHAEFFGIAGIERMLGIHERGHAAIFLRLGNHLQSDRRLAGTLRTKHFDHAPARKAPDAESRVKRDRSG